MVTIKGKKGQHNPIFLSIVLIVAIVAVVGIAFFLKPKENLVGEAYSAIPISASNLSPPATLYGVNLDKILVKEDDRKLAEEALKKEVVSHAALLIPWKKIEPQESVYDWEPIDTGLALLPPGKKTHLNFNPGVSTPEWVYGGKEPVPFVEGDNPEHGHYKIPVPTNQNFLKKWKRLISAVGERYANDPRISAVKISGIIYRTAEYGRMDLGSEEKQKELVRKGMTAQAVINANREIFTAFAKAFPNQYMVLMPVSNYFHFIKKFDNAYDPNSWGVDWQIDWGWGTVELARATQKQAFDIFGINRFILQNNGLVGDTAAGEPSKQAVLEGMKKYRAIGGLTAWQMGWAVTDVDDPEHHMGTDTPCENLRSAFKRGFTADPLYVEVYKEDIISDDPSLQNITQKASQKLLRKGEFDIEQCGIQPNTTSKTLFLSSQTYTGNLGGLQGADAKCQSLASNAGLSGIFKAWLSDSVTSAASRLTHATVPYKLIDGAGPPLQQLE